MKHKGKLLFVFSFQNESLPPVIPSPRVKWVSTQTKPPRDKSPPESRSTVYHALPFRAFLLPFIILSIPSSFLLGIESFSGSRIKESGIQSLEFPRAYRTKRRQMTVKVRKTASQTGPSQLSRYTHKDLNHAKTASIQCFRYASMLKGIGSINILQIF